MDRDAREVAPANSRSASPPRASTLRFDEGDELRTEISCKYTRESLEARLAGTGLSLDAWFADPERLFGLALLR